MDRSLVFPSVLYPCSLDMTATKEEQFGPLVPILKYSSDDELRAYMRATTYGQQAAIFSTDASALPPLVDFLAHQVNCCRCCCCCFIDLEHTIIATIQVTRININAQCQRGPDMMPFSGRKCSAIGTLSVYDALRAMSIRVAVATSSEPTNSNLHLCTRIRDIVSHVCYVLVDLLQDVLREGKSNILRADLLI
jgi:glyceraldehyde-3-phosphate dehydrogenase (NADP+)